MLQQYKLYFFIQLFKCDAHIYILLRKGKREPPDLEVPFYDSKNYPAPYFSGSSFRLSTLIGPKASFVIQTSRRMDFTPSGTTYFFD